MGTLVRIQLCPPNTDITAPVRAASNEGRAILIVFLSLDM